MSPYKGGREKETEGGTEEVSGGREMTERGSRETDKGRGRTAETKRGRWRLLPGSGSIGGSYIGVAKKLVEEGKSRTVGVSSVQGGDEFDWPSSLDKKTMSLLFSQGDFRAMPKEGRIGEGVRNRANGWRNSLWKVCKFWHTVPTPGTSISVFFFGVGSLVNLVLKNTMSCSPYVRAKAACKPFDMDGE